MEFTQAIERTEDPSLPPTQQSTHQENQISETVALRLFVDAARDLAYGKTGYGRALI